MYEGASGPPAGGDARLLRLEVVRVPSTASVGEQQAPLGMLVESLSIIIFGRRTLYGVECTQADIGLLTAIC